MPDPVDSRPGSRKPSEQSNFRLKRNASISKASMKEQIKEEVREKLKEEEQRLSAPRSVHSIRETYREREVDQEIEKEKSAEREKEIEYHKNRLAMRVSGHSYEYKDYDVEEVREETTHVKTTYRKVERTEIKEEIHSHQIHYKEKREHKREERYVRSEREQRKVGRDSQESDSRKGEIETPTKRNIMDISDTEMVIQNAKKHAEKMDMRESYEKMNYRNEKRRKYIEAQKVIKSKALSDELKNIQFSGDVSLQDVKKQARKLKKIRERKMRLGVDSSRETREVEPGHTRSRKRGEEGYQEKESVTDSEKEKVRQAQMITFQAQPDNFLQKNENGTFETLGMKVQKRQKMKYVKEETEIDIDQDLKESKPSKPLSIENDFSPKFETGSASHNVERVIHGEEQQVTAERTAGKNQRYLPPKPSKFVKVVEEEEDSEEEIQEKRDNGKSYQISREKGNPREREPFEKRKGRRVESKQVSGMRLSKTDS